MKPAIAPRNRNRTNLIVDSVIFLAFLIVMAPHFSGLAIHEWLGISFGAAIVSHLLLHWQWIVEVTKRLFGKTSWSARANYLLNALLFITIVLIILSGLLISKVALPTIGIQPAQAGSWRMIHSSSTNVFLGLTGLHIALHWKWIVNMVKRYVFAPRTPSRAPQLGSASNQFQTEV